MLSLNTLRTKFGIVLSVVIAGALLAFILSLKSEMGFSGNDPRVGVIGGDKITYSEYYDLLEELRAQNNVQESDEQQSAMLASATWQSLVARHLFMPGFRKAGLRVSEPERQAMISGEVPSQSFYSAFADPRTGLYSVAAVSRFLEEAETNPQAQQVWQQLNEQARLERLFQKYLGLVKGGAYVNSLEVAQEVEGVNKNRSGKWIGKRFGSVPDSIFTVSDSDLKSYYKSHKNAYKQKPSRTLSYVVFEVDPTDEDLLALERNVQEVGARFAATADLKAFVRSDRNGHIADNYVSAAQLTDEEAAALMAGKTYGPVLKNNEWTMARVLDSKVVADSLGIRHIVLPYTAEQLADSLLGVIRAGGDFATLARQYSVYDQTAFNGGEVGVLPFSAFSGEFTAALGNARRGDVVKVASGDAIQLMQVYRADRPSKHVQVASITYPVEASAATRREAHNQAGTFTVNAKGGSTQAFNDAAAAAAVTPRVVTLVQGDRTLRGVEDSREIARWAYGAEVGDVSEIFKVGKDYVVAVVTEIDNAEYTPLKKVAAQIRAQVLRDKKYDYLVKELAGSTLEEQAAAWGVEPVDFVDVASNTYFVDGAGMEPRLIGAIVAGKTGVVSAPVKGLSGVYVFRVDDVQPIETQTAGAERVRAQAMVESMLPQLSLQAIQDMAGIEDLRGKYF